MGSVHYAEFAAAVFGVSVDEDDTPDPAEQKQKEEKAKQEEAAAAKAAASSASAIKTVPRRASCGLQSYNPCCAAAADRDSILAANGGVNTPRSGAAVAAGQLPPGGNLPPPPSRRRSNLGDGSDSEPLQQILSLLGTQAEAQRAMQGRMESMEIALAELKHAMHSTMQLSSRRTARKVRCIAITLPLHCRYITRGRSRPDGRRARCARS